MNSRFIYLLIYLRLFWSQGT